MTKQRLTAPPLMLHALPAWIAIVSAVGVAIAATYVWWWWAGRPVDLVDAPGGRFPCLSYAPYQGGQTPYETDLMIPPTQIEADLRLLSERTNCVRTYEMGHGIAEVVPIASPLGMKVMLGAWIGDKADKNVRELADAVRIANQYPETVKALIVGNEVLLRGEYSPEGLKRLIGTIRTQVGVPVTYADLWSIWKKYPDVADAVDFLTIHTLHYWDNSTKPVEEAAKDSLLIAQMLAEAHPGKPVFIGEAGWPSAGRMRQEAEPNLLNQARYVRQLIVAADKAGTGLNIIEAFDQPWKRRPEGTVGGFWGVFDADRQPKFPLTGPVREDPNWLLHFSIAATIGVLMFLPGFVSRRRPGVLGAVTLAFVGQIAGTGLVMAFLQGLDASYNVFTFVVWSGRWLLTLAAVLLFPFALVRRLAGDRLRPMAIIELLTRFRRGRSFGRMQLDVALGVVRGLTLFTAAVTMLCFVFDGRHRDFPMATYAVTAVILLVFAIVALETPAATRSADNSSEYLAEERLLAFVLVAGSIVSPVIEGFGNWQALVWAAVCVTLAVAVHLDRRVRDPLNTGEPKVSGRSNLSAAMSSAAPDSSVP